MYKILMVLLGGSIGALLRYLLTSYSLSFLVPWQIITVNYIGSFLIGVFYESLKNVIIVFPIKELILIGFLGAFTTFSSYSLDAVRFLLDGKYKQGLFYIFWGNISALIATFIGILLVKYLKLLLIK